MKKACLFPGQGSQFPRMLNEFVNTHTFEVASNYLGFDARELTTELALEKTAAVQLSLLISEVAAYESFKAAGVRFDYVAGHSVGAFGAAVAAGVISFTDALDSVRLRGDLMEAAHPVGYGMGVVLGLEESVIKKLIESVVTDNDPVYLANLNAPLQITISGTLNGLEKVLKLALEKGAHTATLLDVVTPSHSPLLNKVSGELAVALEEISFNDPKIPYVSNKRARLLYKSVDVKADLVKSVATSVRWHDATTLLYERGVRLFVEMPPGSVLTKLATQAFPDARGMSVSDNGIDNCIYLANR